MSRKLSLGSGVSLGADGLAVSLQACRAANPPPAQLRPEPAPLSPAPVCGETVRALPGALPTTLVTERPSPC